MFPFIVVSKSKSRDWKCETFSRAHVYFVSQSQLQRLQTHFRNCTLVVPTGKISIDFPQNLFLHLRSAKDPRKEDHLTLSYPSIPTQLWQFVYLITLPEDVVFTLRMASRDWRVVADLWSEDWLSDASRVLWMIMWLINEVYIPALPQTESLYQACHIHTSLLERGWKAFLRFCDSWKRRSTPRMWQCMPNQTEGVRTIKVRGTRILFKHFWYSQLIFSTVVFPGQNTLVIYISVLHRLKAAQRFLLAPSKRPPHHTLARVGRVSSLFQQLAVLQLLTHPLQGVERLVELHGHLHFGELFADVVPEDVPQADVDLGAGGRETGSTQRGNTPLFHGGCRQEMGRCLMHPLECVNQTLHRVSFYLNFVGRRPSRYSDYPRWCCH